MIKKLILIMLLTQLAYASYFTNPTITNVSTDGADVVLTWDVDKVTSQAVTNFRYKLQYDTDAAFSPLDGNLTELTFNMFDPANYYNLLLTKSVGPLPAGVWHFRLFIVQLPDENRVTEYSNTVSAVIEEGLGAPTLTLDILDNKITTQSISCSIGGPWDAMYNVYYGTDPNISQNPNVLAEYIDANVNHVYHIIDISTKFSPGDIIFFIASARNADEEVFSAVKYGQYVPDEDIVKYVPHVTNSSNTVTELYIRSLATEPVRLEFRAKIGGGIWNPGTPQTAWLYIDPNETIWVLTDDVFPGIHRKPITVAMEGPVEVSSKITIWGDVPAPSGTFHYQHTDIAKTCDEAGRNITIDNVHGKFNELEPGFVVSNVTQNQGSVTAVFISLNERLNPSRQQYGPHSISVPGYSSEVRMFSEVFNNLPNEYAGTLYLSSGTVEFVALASITSVSKLLDSSGNQVMSNGKPVKTKSISFIEQTKY